MEEENLEKKEETSKNTKEYGNQTKGVVIVMAVLILSILVTYLIVQESKEFKLNGMKFYKEKEGNVLYYKSLLGYATASGQNIPFILKLRHDPRRLDSIPIDGFLRLKGDVVLSLAPALTNCSETYITMMDFSRTLTGFGYDVEGATTDKNYAKEHNATLADCRSSMNKTVIVMIEGNETKISQEKVFFKDCYIIEISNCEIQESFERFIVGLVENSMVGLR